MDKTLLVFLLTFVFFLVIDGAWISIVALSVYKTTLKDVINENIRVVPGILFYVIYIAGAVWFAGLPAVNLRSPQVALRNGAVLGAVCYATYSCTNLAIIKDWTWGITLSDIAWGAVATGSSSYLAVRAAMKLKPEILNPAAPLAYEAV